MMKLMGNTKMSTDGRHKQNTKASGCGETVSIYVAAHKKVQMKLPEGYQICQVNAEQNGKWTGNATHDNNGIDNISVKNDRYCELTALYELWKNNSADIKGLVHYRRFFTEGRDLPFQAVMHDTITPRLIHKHILKKQTIIQELKTNDIIVQFPRQPDFLNAYENLLRFVYPQDIRKLSDVIHKDYPDYEESYKTVLKSTHISYLNMFIARKETFSAYCKWLFDVLFKLEKEIETEAYDDQHKRIFGYLGEVLLNVWICRQKPRVKYVHSVKVAQRSSITLLVRNSRIGIASYLLCLKRFRKTAYTACLNRIERLKEVGQKPFTYTLDRDYQKISSLEDAERYVVSFNIGTVCRKAAIVNRREYNYICLKTEGSVYQYLQSNNSCIITVFIDNTADIETFIRSMYLEYGEKFTVHIRILTNNPEVCRYGDCIPEIYVYEMRRDRLMDE